MGGVLEYAPAKEPVLPRVWAWDRVLVLLERWWWGVSVLLVLVVRAAEGAMCMEPVLGMPGVGG